VDVSTLAAVVRHESNFYPYAIHINGPVKLSRQPADLAEASAVAERLIASGYNFDLGLGQINSRNLKRLGLDPSSAFDSCRNLQAAARVLQQWCYQPLTTRFGAGQVALRAAVDCYHSGLNGIDRDGGRYTRSVIQAARSNQRQANGGDRLQRASIKDLP
jgi:type IV secretion system protein VirB1